MVQEMEYEVGKTGRKLDDVTSEEQQTENREEKGFEERNTGWNEDRLYEKKIKWGKLKHTLEKVITHINRVENKVILQWMNLRGLLAV